jgi:uncharacterized protein (TIGR03435 family)
MRNRRGLRLIAGALAGAILTAGSALAQASAPNPATAGALTFDVASVRVSPAPDMQKMMMDLQAGKKPESVHIDGSRAVFTYMSVKQLIAYAYKMRVYEVTGPDWMVTDRFDIVARMPAAASKDDAPAMLQTLLKERFGLVAHRQVVDQPVLGLVAGKNGAKLLPAAANAEVLDESAPLKPGESMVDSPDGRVLLRRNGDGSTTYVGPWGSFSLKFDGQSLSMHMQSESIDMRGFASMMTQLGGGEGRQVVDMTGLKGKYQAAADFSLMDLTSSLHDQGIEIPTGPPGSGQGGATDPEGGATVSATLEKLGLKLEKSRADVDRLVVDHVEKSPTEN